MKRFILLLFSLIPLVTFAQNLLELPKDKNGSIHYYEKVQIDTLSKNQLYLNSKLIFLNAFKSSNYIIQLDDPKEGFIIGTGFNDISFKFRGVDIKQQMRFTIKIQCRDGFYDFDIYDIHCISYPNNKRAGSEPSFENFYSFSDSMDNNIQDIIRIVKNTMTLGILRQNNPREFKFI